MTKTYCPFWRECKFVYPCEFPLLTLQVQADHESAGEKPDTLTHRPICYTYDTFAVPDDRGDDGESCALDLGGK